MIFHVPLSLTKHMFWIDCVQLDRLKPYQITLLAQQQRHADPSRLFQPGYSKNREIR